MKPKRLTLVASWLVLGCGTGTDAVDGAAVSDDAVSVASDSGAAADGGATPDGGVPTGWGIAELVETNNPGDATWPRIAVDASGNALAVWRQAEGLNTRVWANRFVVGSGWGPPELIETFNSARFPQLAVDAAGNGLAVWQLGTPKSIWANRFVVGVGWGTAQLIETSSGDAWFPEVAFDASGNAIAVWYQDDGQRFNAWANRYIAGSGWGTAELIETSDGDVFGVQIAVQPNGNAAAIWSQDNGGQSAIWANHYIVGTGWGTATPIDAGGEDAHNPQIAIDASGNALAMWDQGPFPRPSSIWANRYIAGTGWGTAQLIETDSSDNNAFSGDIGVDTSGNGLAIWSQEDGTRVNVWANRFTAATGWGTAQLLETENAGDAWASQVAFDVSGNAAAVWTQSDGTRVNIWTSRYVVGSGWETAHLLETDDGDTGFPQVAFDASGNALAVWWQSDGTRTNIWANRFSNQE